MLNDETLVEKFLNKGFWIYVFTLLGAPLLYVIRVIITNDLSVSEAGAIYSIIGLIGIVIAINDFGLNATLNYYLPKHWIAQEYDKFKSLVYISFGLKFITGVILGSITYIFLDVIAESYLGSTEYINVIKIFIGYFLCINLFQITSAFFGSIQDTFLQQAGDFIRKLFIAIFIIIIFISDSGSLGNYALAWMIGIFITTIIIFLSFLKKYQSKLSLGRFIFDWGDFRRYLNFGLWATIGTNAMILIDHIDQQMILYFLGTEMAGYYASLISLVMIITFLFTPLVSFLFPVVSEIVSKNQIHKLSLLQDFFYKYFLIGTLSIGFLLSALGNVVAIVLFGEKYLFSGILLQYVAIFGSFKIIFMMNFAILMGMGQTRKRTLVLLSVLGFNILFNLLLIPVYGVLGGVFSAGISWLLIAIISFVLINQNCKINFDWRFLIKNILYFGVCSFLIYYTKRDIILLNNDFRIENLIFIVAISAIYYGIFLLINIKEISLLGALFKKLKKETTKV